MCGIFGFYKYTGSQECKPLESIMYHLALSNIQRGRDSTGMAIISYDNRMHLVKKLGDANQYYHAPKVQKGLRVCFDHTPKLILGHTRAATTGEVNLVNAQPFIYNNVIGVHNGIIGNYKEKFKEYGLKPQTTCDSEVIFAGMSTTKDYTERAKLLSDLDGYLAIAFLDLDKPDCIHLASVYNDALYIYTTPYGIFFSSIQKPLKKLLKRYRIPCKEIIIGSSDMLSISNKGIVEHTDIPFSYTPVTMFHNAEAFNSGYHYQHDDLNRICDNCYELSREPLNYRLVSGYGICKKCEGLYFADYDNHKPKRGHHEV